MSTANELVSTANQLLPRSDELPPTPPNRPARQQTHRPPLLVGRRSGAGSYSGPVTWTVDGVPLISIGMQLNVVQAGSQLTITAATSMSTARSSR